jgi:type IV pilus assembly protein PilX
MITSAPLPRRPMALSQSGVTLIVALVFLLIITVLGISSMRGVALESRITGNLKQEKMLEEAAEAGLRIGELSITRVSGTVAPAVVRACTTDACMPWMVSELTAESTTMDTPTRFTSTYATNVATVSGYDTKIQWYVVQIGKLDKSMNSCALTGCGVLYFEVNSCASTVLCTSDTTTRRVIKRSVYAHYYPPQQ